MKYGFKIENNTVASDQTFLKNLFGYFEKELGVNKLQVIIPKEQGTFDPKLTAIELVTNEVVNSGYMTFDFNANGTVFRSAGKIDKAAYTAIPTAPKKYRSYEFISKFSRNGEYGLTVIKDNLYNYTSNSYDLKIVDLITIDFKTSGREPDYYTKSITVPSNKRYAVYFPPIMRYRSDSGAFRYNNLTLTFGLIGDKLEFRLLDDCYISKNTDENFSYFNKSFSITAMILDVTHIPKFKQ